MTDARRKQIEEIVEKAELMMEAEQNQACRRNTDAMIGAKTPHQAKEGE